MTTNVDGLVVLGAIEEKWKSLRQVLGNPTTNEAPTFDTVGRSQNFKGGMISWHPALGAHEVGGLIGERWLQLGREQFGYPITDEAETSDGHGRFNHFRSVGGEASIFFTPATGAQEIFGAIRDLWATMSPPWERSPAGYPVAPEQDRPGHPGEREQEFQHGRIVWSRETGKASFEAG